MLVMSMCDHVKPSKLAEMRVNSLDQMSIWRVDPVKIFLLGFFLLTDTFTRGFRIGAFIRPHYGALDCNFYADSTFFNLAR